MCLEPYHVCALLEDTPAYHIDDGHICNSRGDRLGKVLPWGGESPNMGVKRLLHANCARSASYNKYEHPIVVLGKWLHAGVSLVTAQEHRFATASGR